MIKFLQRWLAPRVPDVGPVGIVRTHDEVRALRPGVPVLIGPDGARFEQESLRCIACGVTGGPARIGPALIELEWMSLCVDYRACTDRLRRDELTLMTMGRVA